MLNGVGVGNVVPARFTMSTQIRRINITLFQNITFFIFSAQLDRDSFISSFEFHMFDDGIIDLSVLALFSN